MVKKKHELVPDLKLIQQMDYTLPKLKYSLSFKKIIRWLENFEANEVELAIDFLFFLEYIDMAELSFRIDELFRQALYLIPRDHNIVIYPGVSSYPKSPEVINYILKDTPAYKTRTNCTIVRDLSKILDRKTATAFILIDDFIGSGGSFEKGYDTVAKLKSWMDVNPFIQQRHLIAVVCMKGGSEFIRKKYSEIHIHAEVRDEIFNTATSPFRISQNTSLMRDLALKYGKQISKTSLGFSNNAALVAFGHTTPNNTLPIIWSSNNWHPIYPRFADDKIQQSKEIKSEVAYYIGIMNRLGLDLYTQESIIISGRREIRYNHLVDHSLLTIIKLLQDGFEFPTICQILGITVGEYKKIEAYGVERKLLDSTGKISSTGIEFYISLMKSVRNKRFLKKDKEVFELKNLNYVPKSFMGVT